MKSILIGLTFITSLSAFAYSTETEYCISEYQKTKDSFDHIRAMEANSEITPNEASILSAMTENALKAVDITCEYMLGKRKSQQLKDQIFN